MYRPIYHPRINIHPTAIEDHFRESPHHMEKKRGQELLAGCVLSKVFETFDGHLGEIALPLKQRPDEPYTLSELITNESLHVDADVDLYLINQDGDAHPVQVTRLEEHYTGNNTDEGLINLIRKKSLVPPDNDMILAVLIDVEGTGDFEELRVKIEGEAFPFCMILLLGQFGNDPKLGAFTCYAIYSVIREPITVQLNLGDR